MNTAHAPRRSPSTRLGTVAAGLLVAASVSACSALYREKFVEPDFDLRTRKIAVVPFRRGDRLWHGESREGTQLATQVGVSLARECDNAEVIGDANLLRAVAAELEDPMPWGRIGRDAGAEFILVGDLLELEEKSPRMIGVLRGRVRVDVEIWDTALDRRVFHRQIQVRYPESIESGEIVAPLEGDPDRLRARLFQGLAEEIAGVFCGRMVDTYGK